MRFILTALIWVVIVGGLWLYTQQRQQVAGSLTPSQPQLARLEQQFDLLLTPTFTVESDPFALRVTDEVDTAIELSVNGTRLAIAAERLQRGVALLMKDIQGLVAGHNEIYVQASPPLQESGRSHGLRVQLVRAGSTLLDSTIWAGEGARVAGTVNFVLTGQGTTGEQEDRDEH